MNRKLMHKVASVLVASLLLSGGGQVLHPSPAALAGPPMTKLRIGQIGSVSDAAFFIATDKGYFREQGIELDITRFDSAARMIAPLGTGQLDVGGGAPGAGLLNAIARDIFIKIVADKGNMNPGHGFEAMVVRKQLWDRGALKSVADLRGKTIAISARSISPEVTLDAFLRTGGLTVDDVNIVTLAHAEMGNALANGSVDMALPIEPFVTQIVEKGIGVIWKRNDAVVPRQQVAVVLYSQQFTEAQPELARKFMLAYLKAARFYNDAFVKKDPIKKKEVVEILIRNTGVKDPSLYDKMVMPGINPDGRVNLVSLAALQNWFLKKGVQKAFVDLSKAVDHQYADWAVRQLGPYR